MSKSLLRTDKEIADIYERHRKMLYRICFAYITKRHMQKIHKTIYG